MFFLLRLSILLLGLPLFTGLVSARPLEKRSQCASTLSIAEVCRNGPVFFLRNSRSLSPFRPLLSVLSTTTMIRPTVNLTKENSGQMPYVHLRGGKSCKINTSIEHAGGLA